MKNPETTSGQPGPGHIPQLDGVRGIAILLVLFYHYISALVPPDANIIARAAAQLFTLGWSGVDLFFVLSGFLIGGILLDNRDAPHYFKAFYARRVARIMPLYYGWFALSLIIGGIASRADATFSLANLSQDRVLLLSYLTLTQNALMAIGAPDLLPWLGVTWSLAVEEQFYLTLPLLIRFVPRNKLPFLLLTLIFAAPIARMTVLYLPPQSTFAAYVLMPCRMDALLIGVLAAFIIRQEQARQYLVAHLRAIYILLLLLICALAIMILTATSSVTMVLLIVFGYTLIALIYCTFLVIAIIAEDGLIFRLTRNRILVEAGVLAYGLYLFHEAPLTLAHRSLLGQNPTLGSVQDLSVTLASAALTILLARASWKYFEKPILRLGRSVKYTDV